MANVRDQLWDAGQRFYDASSNDFQRHCIALFRALDSDGDGSVSMAELAALMHQQQQQQQGRGGWNVANVNTIDRVARLFSLLDRDGNGQLDFDECKTLCFLVRFGRKCDNCNALILRDGVTCLLCSDRIVHGPFDLCSSCIRPHGHSRLLQSLPPLLPNLAVARLATNSRAPNLAQTAQHFVGGINLVWTLVEVSNALGCSIM